MSKTVSTKGGDLEIKGAAGNGSDLVDDLVEMHAPRKVANTAAGEVSFVDHKGVTRILRPTFEAAMEIEAALGGLEGVRTRFALGIMQPPSPTTRDYGVVLAAGIRAAGEERVSADKAARFAYDCGRKRLRQPLLDFLAALVDGGRARADDLGKGESSSASHDLDGDLTDSLIQSLESRSAGTSG